MPTLGKGSRRFHRPRLNGMTNLLSLYIMFMCIVNAFNKYLFNESMNEYILLCFPVEIFITFTR